MIFQTFYTHLFRQILDIGSCFIPQVIGTRTKCPTTKKVILVKILLRNARLITKFLIRQSQMTWDVQAV